MSDKIFNLHIYEKLVKLKEHSHIYGNTVMARCIFSQQVPMYFMLDFCKMIRSVLAWGNITGALFNF